LLRHSDKEIILCGFVISSQERKWERQIHRVKGGIEHLSSQFIFYFWKKARYYPFGGHWYESDEMMQNYVREKLQEALTSCDGEYTAEDLMRSFAQEANLMYKTDEVIRTLESDPYEHLDEIKSSVKRLCQLLKVTEYERVLTKTGHCRIAATVTIGPDGKMNKAGVTKYVELFFEYERDGTQNSEDSTSVWYSIDASRDDGPREKILWVKVFAAGSVPSTLPAKNIDEDEDGGWEDIDEDEDEENESSTDHVESRMKKARVQNENLQDENAEDEDEDEIMEDDKDIDDAPIGDRFTAGIDPDVLGQFLRWTQPSEMQDVTAFFLLMSFPFYEMEFDITGYILDAVFGSEDDDDDDDDDDDEGEDGVDD